MRLSRLALATAPFLVVGALVAAPAAAAGSSVVAGSVTDTHGKPVVHATVTLSRSDTPSGTFTPVNGATAGTDKSGHYSFNVTDGFYEVTAQKTDCYAPNSYSNASNSVTPTVTSGVQEAPPGVSNLALTLDCTNIGPVASFTAPTLVKYGAAVTFDASASKDANGTIRSYVWDFGDGTGATTSTPSVTHNYPTIAAFTPRLTVRDDQGASSRSRAGSVSVGTVPGQLTNLSATTTENTPRSITLNWSAPADNGSPISGYTIDVSPPRPSITTTRTTAQIDGLAADTSYTFTVHATNGFGDGAAGVTSGYASGSATNPKILVTHAPVDYTNQGAGTVSFTITPATGGSVTTTTCSLDGQAPTDCHQSPYAFSGLQPGTHTVVIATTDGASHHASASAQWVVDTTAPDAALLAPATATVTSRSVPVAWGGADANGFLTYDVRYLRAAWNGKLGRQTPWSKHTGVATTSDVFRGSLGSEYCFSVRAHDKAGNVSRWTVGRCAAIPLDERSLVASAGWRKESGKAFFNGTQLRATVRGATLTRTGAVAGRAALVVTKAKGFGSIAVVYDGKTVKTVSLAASSTQHQVVIALPAVSKKNTIIVLRVTSAKKPVEIDGLVLARV